MAFLPDEENLQNQAPQGAGTQQTPGAQEPITSSPAPAGGGVGNKGTINQPSSANAAQPFTNLQTYLTANQPQIEQQGATISNSLTGQYGQTKGAIDQAGSDFGNTVKQGYTQNDPQVVNNFSADPSKVAADPNAANTFTGMYNDRYTGPDSFEGTQQYGDLVGQVQKGQKVASQVTSPGGLNSYLMGSNPNETQGMATLDSSLLQGNPGVQQSIAAAAQPFSGLDSYLGNVAKTGDAAVTQAQAAADTVRNQTHGLVDTAHTGLANKLSDQLTNSLGTLQANQANIGGYQQNVQAAQALQNLLMQVPTAAPKADMSTIEPFQFMDVSPAAQPTQETLASADQFAQDAALNKLSGGSVANLLDQSQAGKAGSYHQQTFPDLPVSQNASKAAFALSQAYPALSIPGHDESSPLTQLYNQLMAMAGLTSADQNTSATPTPSIGGGTLNPTTPPPTSSGGHVAR